MKKIKWVRRGKEKRKKRENKWKERDKGREMEKKGREEIIKKEGKGKVRRIGFSFSSTIREENQAFPLLNSFAFLFSCSSLRSLFSFP